MTITAGLWSADSGGDGDTNLTVSELVSPASAIGVGPLGVGEGRLGGSEKSGGSDMTPPISKKSRSLGCWFRRRYLRQQKNNTTPIMKNPDTPEATETPMTAPALRWLELGGAVSEAG